MDINDFVDHFQALVTGETEDNSRLKFAGRKNRKQLTKDLQKAKDKYIKLKTSLEEKHLAAKDIASVIDRDSKQMEAAKSDVLKAYDILKNMDLVDSNEVRFTGKDVGYIKNKRVYRLEVDDTGNVSLQPFKKKKVDDLEDAEEEEDDTAEADDLYSNLME